MKINERFVSYQGSGLMTGQQQYFVRLHGCSVPCPIKAMCDESDALSGEPNEELTVEDVAIAAAESGTGWLHLTGGEPMDQRSEVAYAIAHARDRDVKTHIQTSGAVWCPSVDYLTVSPKAEKVAQNYGDEMILVYDPAWVTVDVANELRRSTSFGLYYMQPLWEFGTCNSDKTLKFMAALKGSWRISGQLHKYLGIR